MSIQRHSETVLSKDILPGLIDELGLNHTEGGQLEGWLRDTASIFRILKRHKFTHSFALEALQSTLAWRVSSLPPLSFAPPTPFLRCLPPTAYDPFGRPIVLVRLAELTGISEDLKPIIIRNMELLRLHLEHLNAQDGEDSEFRPILQFVALLDIKNVSFNSVHNVDLLGWFINEVLPRFPGMLAAVFVLNYSWAHNGLWSIAKRTLPASALCRVFFPSQSELFEYFSPRMIPQDYGGDMLPLPELEDPLHSYLPTAPNRPESSTACPVSPPTQPSSCPIAIATRTLSAKQVSPSRTSYLNPFYGYPVTYTESASVTPTLRYGRRRKRDLVRTLAQLWWMRWKVHATATLCIVALLLLALTRKRWGSRRWRWRLGSSPALRSLVESLHLI
ncbi:CRAL-TRIO domain-containing protein [Cristinia sonorae]|uniref:CRAL-TRIO domain-containing protein n=1 Tax=Cristinia sonorae TaxID=1940300 RepID=A0A8K0XUV3_9AGAR|nr:CRAL-TRIO domain-containing protein [Cristinia sonorae]